VRVRMFSFGTWGAAEGMRACPPARAGQPNWQRRGAVHRRGHPSRPGKPLAPSRPHLHRDAHRHVAPVANPARRATHEWAAPWSRGFPPTPPPPVAVAAAAAPSARVSLGWCLFICSFVCLRGQRLQVLNLFHNVIGAQATRNTRHTTCRSTIQRAHLQHHTTGSTRRNATCCMHAPIALAPPCARGRSGGRACCGRFRLVPVGAGGAACDAQDATARTRRREPCSNRLLRRRRCRARWRCARACEPITPSCTSSSGMGPSVNEPKWE